mmetsp:Transcript_15342/g.31464  ORF Transcript_15342/g.31464 Transcript_15342/m.31464 type:complete len:220 (+) Transcript_15342:1622-2281(+)
MDGWMDRMSDGLKPDRSDDRSFVRSLTHSSHIYLRVDLFVGIFDTLLDLRLQVGDHLVEPSLLVVVDFAVSHDLRHSVGTELAGRREKGGLRDFRFDKGALDDVLGPVHGLQDLVGEQIPGVGHGKGGGPGTGLGLDDLVAAELGPLRDGGQLFAAGGVSLDLREEGEDGDPGVPADDGNVDLAGITPGRGTDEGVGAAVVCRAWNREGKGTQTNKVSE